jgi:adenylate cyclase
LEFRIELELPHEDQPFEKPDWVAEEVSADPRYSNQALLQHPWTWWPAIS